MFFIFGGLALFTILGTFYIWLDDCETKFIITGFVLAIVFTLLTFIPATTIPSSECYDLNEEKASTYYISTIGDGNRLDIEATRRYLNVSSEGEYTFYYLTENGGYYQGKIPAANAYIFEEEDCTPRIESTRHYYTPNSKHIFLDIYYFGCTITFDDYYTYEIYLPIGTMSTENININGN